MLELLLIALFVLALILVGLAALRIGTAKIRSRDVSWRRLLGLAVVLPLLWGPCLLGALILADQLPSSLGMAVLAIGAALALFLPLAILHRALQTSWGKALVVWILYVVGQLLVAALIAGLAAFFWAGRAAPGPPACFGGILEAGNPVAGRLWDGACEYFFEGIEGQVVTLAMDRVSPGLDPQLRLVSPGGEEVAFDDDSGGNGNSLIEGHRLESTGRYTLWAESYGAPQGEFNLILKLDTAPETTQ